MNERAPQSSTEYDFQEQYPDIPVSEDSVKDYFRNIGKVSLLNAEQEVDLSKRIEAGLSATKKLASTENELSPLEREELEWIADDGTVAKANMIEANLRLVASIAAKYNGRGLDMADLIQEGTPGLIRAVEKFDYKKGFKFSTYATNWIRQSIARGIGDTARNIRLPVHVWEDVGKLRRTERTLELRFGREATEQELAKELSITEERVKELHQYRQNTISLDTPIGEDGGATLEDMVHDDAMAVHDEMTIKTIRLDIIKEIQTILSSQELNILVYRYGLDGGPIRPLNEVGKKYGISGERVRQIQNRALKKLRVSKNINFEQFRDLLS